MESSCKKTIIKFLQKRFYFLALAMILIFALGVFAQQQSPSPTNDSKSKKSKLKSYGMIEGTVVDEDGRPLVNAGVLAYVVGGINVVGGSNPNVKETSTDEDGKFRFTNLPSGKYQVIANLRGYVTTSSPDESPKIYEVGETAKLTLFKGGVITGRVTDANGEPVVGITVHAVKVQKNNQTKKDEFVSNIERRTDDRGVYRIYGLYQGRYVVFAGRSQYQNQPTIYDKDAPTYHPSSTRDAATVLDLQTGEEKTGIDISYRNERGYAVSGIVKVPVGIEVKYITLYITESYSNFSVNNTFMNEQTGMQGFEFRGLSDGEYLINAQSTLESKDAIYGFAKVSVKGSDVTGLEINLMPLGSISGRVVLSAEKRANCELQGSGTLEETILRVFQNRESEINIRQPFTVSYTTANGQGEFTLRNLIGANYQLRIQLPTEDWYIKSIVRDARSSTAKTKAANTVSAVPELIAIKDREKLKGLTVNLSTGASSVRGRITPKTENITLPLRLRVYLVPAEKERADDTLRYAETRIEKDGTFAITNLASGRYWVVVRALSEEDIILRPLAWNVVTRAKLRKEAETANMILELKPCQHLKNYQIRF